MGESNTGLKLSFEEYINKLLNNILVQVYSLLSKYDYKTFNHLPEQNIWQIRGSVPKHLYLLQLVDDAILRMTYFLKKTYHYTRSAMTNVLNPNHLEPFAQVICLYVGLQMTSRGILQNTFAKPFIGPAKVV